MAQHRPSIQWGKNASEGNANKTERLWHDIEEQANNTSVNRLFDTKDLWHTGKKICGEIKITIDTPPQTRGVPNILAFSETEGRMSFGAFSQVLIIKSKELETSRKPRFLGSQSKPDA